MVSHSVEQENGSLGFRVIFVQALYPFTYYELLNHNDKQDRIQ